MADGNFNILAIETCTAAGSVAVVRSSDFKVLALNEWTRGRSHAEVMTPAMEDAVKMVGGFKEIKAIAVGIGPGSFTGIRVGLNAAKTAAWNLGLPLVPIRTTDALLEGAIASRLATRPHGEPQNIFAAVLNAQMGLVFAAVAEKKSGSYSFSTPIAVEPLDFAARFKTEPGSSLILIGDGVQLVGQSLEEKGISFRHLDRSLDSPHAATIGRIAANKLSGLQPEALVRNFNWQQAQPLYIRGSGAEEKKG